MKTRSYFVRVEAIRVLWDGQLRIDVPEVPAVVQTSTAPAAEIHFRYLGPTAATKPLASGHVRRQIGLKLRAPDTCAPVASVRVGSSHTLRAILDGDELAVWADGVLAWEGVLPSTLLGL